MGSSSWVRNIPDVATSLNGLANLYTEEGKDAEAEPLYQWVLAIYEQQCGADRSDTANSLNDLAALYRAQGEYKQAEPLLKRALAIYEHVQGREHPTTQTIRKHYASLLRTVRCDAATKQLEAEP